MPWLLKREPLFCPCLFRESKHFSSCVVSLNWGRGGEHSWCLNSSVYYCFTRMFFLRQISEVGEISLMSLHLHTKFYLWCFLRFLVFFDNEKETEDEMGAFNFEWPFKKTFVPSVIGQTLKFNDYFTLNLNHDDDRKYRGPEKGM